MCGASDLCMITHFNLCLCGSFNYDSQILSGFGGVWENANRLDLDGIGG